MPSGTWGGAGVGPDERGRRRSRAHRLQGANGSAGKAGSYGVLIEAFNAGEGHAKGYRATNGGELAEAITKAATNTKGPTLIECVIDRDECTRELIRWGHQVAATNARPPRQA